MGRSPIGRRAKPIQLPPTSSTGDEQRSHLSAATLEGSICEIRLEPQLSTENLAPSGHKTLSPTVPYSNEGHFRLDGARWIGLRYRSCAGIPILWSVVDSILGWGIHNASLSFLRGCRCRPLAKRYGSPRRRANCERRDGGRDRSRNLPSGHGSPGDDPRPCWCGDRVWLGPA
jgi:hypothetical protein